MSARALVLGALLAGCHHGHDCRAELDELGKFFVAVAAEQQASPLREGVLLGEREAGLRHDLVSVQGPPVDLAKTNVLVVGRERAAMVTADDEVREVLVDDRGSWSGDPKHSLVVEFAPDVPWQTVRQVVHGLSVGDPEDHYATVSLAYQTDGVFAGRTPPHIEGATAESVDLARVGVSIAKEAADHCPALAVDFAKLGQSGTLESALPAFARDIASCSCAVDRPQIEALAWLAKRRITTTVPLLPVGSKVPALPEVRDGATFQDVVRANGGRPVTLALEPLPPPPPPPGPH